MFPDSWIPTTIGEISELGSGSTPSRKKQSLYFDGGNTPWVKTGDLNNGLIDSTQERITAAALKETSCKVYPRGTLLVAMYGGFKQIGRTGLLGIDAAINQALTAVAIDSDQAVPDFVQQWLNYRVDDWKRLAGSSRKDPNITKSEIAAFPIHLPTKGEQTAIVRVLKVWDRGIEQVSELITSKVRFKQGLMQQLLSGKQHLWKNNGHVPEQTCIGELVEKVAVAIKVNTETIYREIGIRSHGKGIFYKEPVTGRSLGNKRVYPVVPGCLTFNIVFAWERALAVTTEQEAGMIASHRFPMFQPKRERLLPEYALHYLLSKKGTEAMQLASPGGAGRNRTLSQTEFLKTTIPLPTIVVQRKIVNIVETVEREIDILRMQLKALKQQKRGLMQKLLTGDVRVSSAGRKLRSASKGGLRDE